MNKQQEKLYRKEKKTGLSSHYYVKTGSEYRYQRHTKQTKKESDNEIAFKPMKKGKYDYDYTPLFRFLLSKVGEKWDSIYSEAKSRLDKDEPIFWIVKLEITQDDINDPKVRIGESATYSMLTVNKEGILVKVDPDFTNSYVSCSCCTHTFNGKVVKTNYASQFK